MTASFMLVETIAFRSQLFRESGLFLSRRNRSIRPTRPNGQVVAGRPVRAALSAPMPARRSDLTVIGADKLGLLDDVRLRRFQHVERRGWGSQTECRSADRQRAEVIVMS